MYPPLVVKPRVFYTWIAIVSSLMIAQLYEDAVIAQIVGYTPDVDYPIYAAVPKGLAFTCSGKLPGYYADTETRCQVWHWCLHSGVKFSFLCPNGTVFNQAVRVCDWWNQVNCGAAETLYANNKELYVVSDAPR